MSEEIKEEKLSPQQIREAKEREARRKAHLKRLVGELREFEQYDQRARLG